jgi:curved DNA-binding protein CbpA
MKDREADPMSSSPPDSPEPFGAWLEVLDDLTYYELFGLDPRAGADDVRAAFHVFCDTFHPDRHFGRPAPERDAASTIFKRGTEAYLVLGDVGLRGHYDAELSARPKSLPPRIRFSSHARPARSVAPEAVKLEDSASAMARPYARRAEELIRAGDLRQAKLQLVMATHFDRDNEVLVAALQEVEARLKPGVS